MDQFSCLAIDMGAGSIRIMLGEFSAKLTLTEVHRFANEIIFENGHERWDLVRITNEIKKGLEKAAKLSVYPIQSVAVDSWGVDHVFLDSDLKPLANPFAYRDKRTDGMLERWENEFLSAKETFERTGINFYPFNTLFQFLSVKDKSEFAHVRAILFMANYIAFYLSGVLNNELSLCSTSQMIHITTNTWDELILKKLALKSDQFSEPQRCGTVIGKVRSEFKLSNAKVCLAPSHDTASAIEAIPATTDNYAYISTGTWCIMGMKSTMPITIELAFTEGITNEITSPGNIKVHKNAMGLWLIQKLKEELFPDLSYGELEQRISGFGSSGITIDPNDNRLYNPGSMKLVFDELLSEAGYQPFKNPLEYFWCAYESLAASFKEILDVLINLRNRKFDCLHMLGGGIQSQLLCRLTAKSVGIPVHAGPVEGATIGNMLWQSVAMGYASSIEEAHKIVGKSFGIKTYNPEKED
ncbi:rhamnulokinase family protein [Saccharicrinis sp. FJH2]|uniref:rhamnulokinase n=1 Tax=Saccharicrinis sp. FJH65 TaxID=3344659 RepID=UPI0035F4919C